MQNRDGSTLEGVNMAEQSEGLNESADYRRGLADGGAQKWRSIRDMWGGLGFFLIILLLFVAPGLYDSYNDHQIKMQKVQACSRATDVTNCIRAVGK